MSLLISKIIGPSARLSSTISWIIDWIFLFLAKKKETQSTAQQVSETSQLVLKRALDKLSLKQLSSD